MLALDNPQDAWLMWLGLAFCIAVIGLMSIPICRLVTAMLRARGTGGMPIRSMIALSLPALVAAFFLWAVGRGVWTGSTLGITLGPDSLAVHFSGVRSQVVVSRLQIVEVRYLSRSRGLMNTRATMRPAIHIGLADGGELELISDSRSPDAFARWRYTAGLVSQWASRSTTLPTRGGRAE